MFKCRLLKAKLVEQGKTNDDAAAVLGVDASTFSKKLNGVSDFKRGEIQILRSFLQLTVEESEAIFFADELAQTQDK